MAIEIDWGGQAFPTEGGADSGLYPDPGMSLRDWFAGQALCATAEIHNGIGVDPRGTAIAAYQFADAMIAARKAGAE
jgi:hypothetical protein